MEKKTNMNHDTNMANEKLANWSSMNAWSIENLW
jgi:hypothetical protein